MSTAYIYGLVHKSDKFFKIGKAASIDARAKYIGTQHFNWNCGISLMAKSSSHVIKVERLSHDAMREWRLGAGESSLIPQDGQTEWFSTKGFFDFWIWCGENCQSLGIKECRFSDVVSTVVRQPLGRENAIDRFNRLGIEPMRRGKYILSNRYYQSLKGPATRLSIERHPSSARFSISTNPPDAIQNPSGPGYNVDFEDREKCDRCEYIISRLLDDFLITDGNGGCELLSITGWEILSKFIASMWIDGLIVSSNWFELGG